MTLKKNLKLSWKWNLNGRMKDWTLKDLRRKSIMIHEGCHWISSLFHFFLFNFLRLANFWVPDPFILHQRSLFSARIMKNSEALRVYPDSSLKYGVLQNVRQGNIHWCLYDLRICINAVPVEWDVICSFDITLPIIRHVQSFLYHLASPKMFSSLFGAGRSDFDQRVFLE